MLAALLAPGFWLRPPDRLAQIAPQPPGTSTSAACRPGFIQPSAVVYAKSPPHRTLDVLRRPAASRPPNAADVSEEAGLALNQPQLASHGELTLRPNKTFLLRRPGPTPNYLAHISPLADAAAIDCRFDHRRPADRPEELIEALALNPPRLQGDAAVGVGEAEDWLRLPAASPQPADFAGPVADLVTSRDRAAQRWDQSEVLPPQGRDLSEARIARRRDDAPTGAEVQGRVARLSRHSDGDQDLQLSGDDGPGPMWPRPAALLEQLDRVRGDLAAEAWARNVSAALGELRELRGFDSPPVQPVLARLVELARQGDALAFQLRDEIDQHIQVQAAAGGLARRARLWQEVHALSKTRIADGRPVGAGPAEMHRLSQAALGTIDGVVAPQAWREFLRLDDLEAAFPADGEVEQDAPAVARLVLERLHSRRLNARQRQVISAEPFDALDRALRMWAGDTVDLVELLYAVERYEESQGAEDAARLADQALQLRWSSQRRVAALGRSIDDAYRGPNLRVAVTADLLNRLLTDREPQVEEVSEQVLNSYVVGQRQSSGEMSVELTPDPYVWRLRVEARGQVATDTVSHAEGAAFFTTGQGGFLAQKRFTVNHHDVLVWPAQADAQFQSQLYGVQTNWDSLPLIAEFARSRAVNGFHENAWAAQQQVQERMRLRAAKMLDEEANEPLFETYGRLQESIIVPLDDLSVEPTTLALKTTEQRLIGEYRLAGLYHASAHTPRPWALQDSLMSVQIHQSAINNAIDGMRLEGRSDSLIDVYRDIYAAFGAADVDIPEELPDDVEVHFAEDEPVRVRFADGLVEVVLRLKRLKTDRRTWKDLVVRNSYMPDASTRRAVLVRHGSVGVKGARLRLGDQIAVRSVFTKVFSQNDEIPLFSERLTESPGLADLGIIQYVIRDGWIAVALGAGAAQPLSQTPIAREARKSPSPAH